MIKSRVALAPGLMRDLVELLVSNLPAQSQIVLRDLLGQLPGLSLMTLVEMLESSCLSSHLQPSV